MSLFQSGVNATLSDFRYENLFPDIAGGRYGWNATTVPPPKQMRRMANFFDKIVSQLRFNGISVTLGTPGLSLSLRQSAAHEAALHLRAMPPRRQ